MISGFNRCLVEQFEVDGLTASAWRVASLGVHSPLRMLDHDLISVELRQAFDKSMLVKSRYCFNSMPIDEFFDFAEGPLTYRSIKFHNRTEPATYARGSTVVVNFTDGRVHTRETDWSRLPGHRVSGENKTITLEEPCDYLENDQERY